MAHGSDSGLTLSASPAVTLAHPRPLQRSGAVATGIGGAKRVDTPPPNPFNERDADGTCPYETDDCDCYSPQEDEGSNICAFCGRSMRPPLPSLDCDCFAPKEDGERACARCARPMRVPKREWSPSADDP